MDNDTKKILIAAVVLIISLNLIGVQSKKNFEKSVLEVIKNNQVAIKVALGENNIPPFPPQIQPPVQPESEEEQFKRQLEDKVVVDIGDTPVSGNRSAKIKLVVFSDFQCPFSKRGAETVKALKQKYGNNLMFVHKNLPLPFHPEAKPASIAVLAAGKQGKFYEYHDKLYENQGQLGEEMYIKIARDLGLNIEKFNADRNNKEIADQVEADISQANRLGFNGTPGFALNGVKILGAYPVEHFEKVINALGLG